MTSKRLLALVSITVIAVLVIIINAKLSNQKPSEQSLKFFNDKIGAFVIKDPSGTVTVHKKGDLWVASHGVKGVEGVESQVVGSTPQVGSVSGDFATDSASVAIALEKLSDMKKSILISENSDKQAIFEVDTAKGLFVEVFDLSGKSKGSVLIGKSGPDWNSNYIRSVGSNKVYTVDGGIRNSFFTDITRWRDKLMMSFDKASTKSILLVKGSDSTISLTKADSGSTWNIISPITSIAKNDQVEGILSTLSRFNATDFQDSELTDSAMGFTKPQLTISIGLAGGSKKISIGAKRDDGKYYAMVEGKPTVYLINDSEFTSLNKDLNSLKEVPVKPAEPVASVVTPKKKK